MAGGRGLRLHPLTESKPKPLLPVGSRPILETIIDGFADQGFRQFHLCLGYMADLIAEYFGTGEAKGLKIRYVIEDTPLGTGGALRLLPKFDVPFIVSNSVSSSRWRTMFTPVFDCRMPLAFRSSMPNSPAR